jgi:hypothetical protein
VSLDAHRISRGALFALMLAATFAFGGCSSEDGDHVLGTRHQQRSAQTPSADTNGTSTTGGRTSSGTPPTPTALKASVQNGVPVPGGIADNAVKEVQSAANTLTTQVAAGDRVAAVQAVLASSQKVAGNLGVNGVPNVTNLRTMSAIAPAPAGDAAVAAVGDLEAAVQELIAQLGAGDAAAAVQAILDACTNIAGTLGVALPGNLQLPGLPAGGGLPIPGNAGAGDDGADGAGAGAGRVPLLDCTKIPAIIRGALEAAGKC